MGYTKMNRIGLARAIRGLLNSPQNIVSSLRLNNPIAYRYYNLFGGMLIFMTFFTNIFDTFGNYSPDLLRYKLWIKMKGAFLPQWLIPYSWRIQRNSSKQQRQTRSSGICLLYTSPSPRDATLSRMPSSA
eukprot:TRINITY_DN730_c0_g2_i3.p2 TRINITY_DN730_c0_g2~~TRINITY_DN730_c0_g2_i3.p2  ORF type:complete len:142 (-),score=22.09 TRINITY_DN730_c0_g2_i3:16-405(-)